MDGQLLHMLNAQIAQRVRPDQLVDLLDGVAGGNQVFLVGNVGAEVARVGERRGADAVVYLAAPASRSRRMVRALVVPRTMESSTSTTRLPLTVDVMAFSLMRTLLSRWAWLPE